MIFKQKSAVKNHLSSRNRNGIHLHRPASQPDATGFSGEDSVRAESNTSIAVEETPIRPSGQENSPADTGSGSSNVAAIKNSKSAQS
jgi:hypothetical protein